MNVSSAIIVSLFGASVKSALFRNTESKWKWAIPQKIITVIVLIYLKPISHLSSQLCHCFYWWRITDSYCAKSKTNRAPCGFISLRKYLAASNFHKILTKFSSASEEKQPHNLLLLPQYFIARWYHFSGVCLIFLRLTITPLPYGSRIFQVFQHGTFKVWLSFLPSCHGG